MEDLHISQNEIFILVGISLLFGLGIAFTIITSLRVPEMKKGLPVRLALIATMEGLCLIVLVFALLVMDL